MKAARRYAVCGRPIGHSQSPALFAHAYPGDIYFRLACDDAAEAMRMAESLSLSGLNVTAPFKRALLPFAARQSERVKELGAANSLRKSADGDWLADNSDVDGAIELLAAAGEALDGSRPVAVLGAGGAAAAAVAAIHALDLRAVIINRSEERARQLAAQTGAAVVSPAEAVSQARVIVSCLPPDAELGLAFRSDQILLDAAYPDSQSARAARQVGAIVVSGERWLLAQAWRGFGWLRGEAELPTLALPKRTHYRRVVLVGMMGAGKSTMGEILAKRLGVRFLDTDADYESAYAESIATTFATRGEAAFRTREARIVKAALCEDSALIACGGGAVLHSEFRQWVGADSFVIWLWASPQVLAERLAGQARPLLVGGDTRERLEKLCAARDNAYAACASLVIDAGARDLTTLVNRCMDEIRSAGIAPRPA